MGSAAFDRVSLGQTSAAVTRLGLGTAALGGWPDAVPVEQAVSTVQRAWAAGVRYFDTAPFYGYGNSEQNIGRALADLDRSEYTLSTKVGRLLKPGSTSGLFRGGAPFTPYFDFSRAGVLRSLRESLARLGVSEVDIAFVHDPDDHHDEALQQALPALQQLRDMGIVKAIGVGMNSNEALTRFAESADVDCVLVAGRYTLLEQPALDDLLPVALERGISIIVGGALNSGLLVAPGPGSFYNYAPAPTDVIDRACRIERVCAEFEVPLRAAALQLPLAHPAVASLVAGARRSAEVDDTLAMLRVSVPDELWQRLKADELLRVDAPTPTEPLLV